MSLCAVQTEPVPVRCANSPYSQCGGNEYEQDEATAITCCPFGYLCIEIDETYSQCQPRSMQPRY
eukprot:1785-Heterococcus_DN1.PRE.12